MLLLELPPDFAPRLEVAGCFVESEGEILLVRRAARKTEPGTYGVPAGKLEPGEDRDAGMRRETREETGIELGDMSYYRAVGVRYGQHDILYHMYHARLESRPEVRINPDEHDAYAWRTPAAALLEPLMLDADACIELYYGLADEP